MNEPETEIINLSVYKLNKDILDNGGIKYVYSNNHYWYITTNIGLPHRL